jgi:hypothetical protein
MTPAQARSSGNCGWFFAEPPAVERSSGSCGQHLYPILATWVHEDPLIVHLTIDGELIETTPEHPFRLANGDWVPAAVLEIGGEAFISATYPPRPSPPAPPCIDD